MSDGNPDLDARLAERIANDVRLQVIQAAAMLATNPGIRVLLSELNSDKDAAVAEIAGLSPLDSVGIAKCQVRLQAAVRLQEIIERVQVMAQAAEQHILEEGRALRERVAYERGS